MYGVEFTPGAIKTLGEEGFVVFDTEVRNEKIAGQEEKKARDPGEADGSYWSSGRVHRLVWRSNLRW
jgi:hypothetical protein